LPVIVGLICIVIGCSYFIEGYLSPLLYFSLPIGPIGRVFLFLLSLFLLWGGIFTAVFGGDMIIGKRLSTVLLIIVPFILIIWFAMMVLSSYPSPPPSAPLPFSLAFFGMAFGILAYGIIPTRYRADTFFTKRGFENSVVEFQYVKKIFFVEISILVVTLAILLCIGAYNQLYASQQQRTNELGFVNTITMFIILFAIPGPILRIILLTAKKEFRFYFSKACLRVILYKEEDFDKFVYLILALESYNKYLRRRSKYYVNDNDIKKLYFKYVRATNEEKDVMINSLLEAFEYGGTKPITCISTIIEVPEKEGFLTRESVGQRLKLIGSLLAAAIPILISAIGVYIQYTTKGLKP
jgi:hypothetical protein